MLGARSGKKLIPWLAENPDGFGGSFTDVAEFGEIIILAVKGSAASAALHLAGEVNLKGKTIIDATNPIAEAPPENGVIRFFTSLDKSLMETLQIEFQPHIL